MRGGQVKRGKRRGGDGLAVSSAESFFGLGHVGWRAKEKPPRTVFGVLRDRVFLAVRGRVLGVRVDVLRRCVCGGWYSRG